MIKPVLTEKSLGLAKEGQYTFWISRGVTKNQAKKLVSLAYGVNVTRVRTINIAGETKRSVRGEKRVVAPRKKVVVTLKDKEKIEVFDTKK